MDDDAQLMMRAAAGDMQAFAELVSRHEKPLMNFFARCGVQTDVEDLAQLTFLKLHRVRRRYRPTAKFTTFLYLLARQTMIDAARAAGRRAALHEKAGKEIEPSVPAPALRGEKSDARLALSKLSPGLRAAVVLVVMQGFAYNEAATVLGVPTGTVKSRVNAALRQMRETLSEGKGSIAE